MSARAFGNLPDPDGVPRVLGRAHALDLGFTRHARSVADLALERPRLDDVRGLVSEVRRRGLCTTDELWTELDAGPVRGSRNLRAALVDIGDGAWSAPEARTAHSDEHHWNDPADRDRTTRRHSLLQMCGFTVMSRRPGAVQAEPRRSRADVRAWLGARARDLAA